MIPTTAPSGLRSAAVVLGLAHGLWAVWLLSFPAALPSDDALFFARALTRFSVLEFAPHFPGYPGYVVLGRLAAALVGDPVRALFLTSAACAIAIPAAAAWLVWRATGQASRALLGWALALTQPLLPGLGLGMLSDGAGLLGLLLAAAVLSGRRWGWGGVLLGAALCCRPSNAVPGLALLAWGCWSGRWRTLIGCGAVCGLGFGAVLLLEGWPYLEEGGRFLRGHATVWGNTAWSDAPRRLGWADALAALPGGSALAGISLLAALLALAAPRARPIAIAALGSAIWAALMQNPENLRHLAPVAVLCGVAAAICRPGLAVALLGCGLWSLVHAVQWTPAPPPLAAAIAHLSSLPPGTVITNHGVALMRLHLSGQRVIDAAYAPEARFAWSSGGGPAYRITGGASAASARRSWPGRVPGETGLGLEETVP